MKSVCLLLFLSCVVATNVACHAPVTVTTQAGKIAYTADQIAQRVNELENAAIRANAASALPLSSTRLIVEFCVSADKILATTPAGWQASLTTLWQQTKINIDRLAIPPTTNPAVLAAINAVDVVLAVTTGGN